MQKEKKLRIFYLPVCLEAGAAFLFQRKRVRQKAVNATVSVFRVPLLPTCPVLLRRISLPSPPVDAALILVGKIQGPASPDPLVQLTNGKREDGVVGVADEGGVWGLLPLARLLHLLHPGTFSPLPLLPPVYFLDLNRVYIQNHTKKQIFWHALLLLLKKIVASIINQEK
jgi:hypothetical protein